MLKVLSHDIVSDIITTAFSQLEGAKTKEKIIIISVFVVTLSIIVCSILFYNKNKAGVMKKESITNIEVTENEMKDYKQKIGTDMDIKRNIIILFNSKETAQEFITNYGDKDVLSLAKGITPQLEEKDGVKFYNVVGNGTLEPIFDRLKNGEHYKEPIEFGGMWAYFKRIDTYSPISNEKDLKAFIQNEKALQKKAGD
jgi:hypothetical protein